MAADALDILRLCSYSPWLGADGLVFGTATGGSTTTLVDTGLATFAGDERLKHRFVYFTNGDNAGGERFITAASMSNGTLSWGNGFGNPVVAGDHYILLRDFRFAQWLAWMDETAKSLHYSKQVYLRGISDFLRYTLPTPISQGGWIEAVMIGAHPFSFSEGQSRRVQWHRLNPANVEGDLHLVLQAAIGPGEQLLFLVRPPYLHAERQAYTMTRSTLTPLGETTPAGVPARLIAAGTIWRALRQKVGNLTGEARALWAQNLEMAARAYAQACSEHGVKSVGTETLGYSETW